MPHYRKTYLARLLAAAVLCVAAAGGALAAKNGFSDHDAKDPIQFSADRLEVKKEGSVAVFTGKVEAVQGDMTLLADEVRVYYEGGQKTEGGQSSGLSGSVSRIDSRGNVRITSRGDSAEGDWAVYDVPRQLVTMGGRVVLRQGGTVVRGSRLELNLDSGKANFQGLPNLQGEQRVRGEFVPATGGSGNQKGE
jgi:lipopolysaccharide export system protein LptA